MDEIVKFVVTAPEPHADIVRKALGDTGAGSVDVFPLLLDPRDITVND